MRVTRHHSCWVSPFGHPRIHARLTAPRGITQPPTSFIGSQCQGIHHAPLNTYNTKPKIKNNLRKITYKQQAKSTHPHKEGEHNLLLDARNHYPQIKHHTPPPSGATTRQPHTRGRHHLRFPTLRGKEVTGLLSQSPIVCLAVPSPKNPAELNPVPVQRLSCTRTPPTTGERPIHRIAQHTEPPRVAGGSESRGAP
jgi:hypothetical protein